MTIAERPRLISLVPSATETLLALGANVVGCTRFCNQPGLATYGGTKNPDIAAILAAAPDAVVVDVEENRREDADELRSAGVKLVVTAVRSVDDAVAVVAELAHAGGVSAPPPAAMHHATSIGTVFVPIWRRPWMTINGATYGASLLASVGWSVVTAAWGDPYPQVELGDPMLRPVDLVAVPSEPYSFDDTHLGELSAAFPGVPVVRIDGEDLFWWGIRTPGAQRRLADTISSARAQR